MFDEFDDTDVQVKDEESSSDEDGPKEMGFGKVSSIATVHTATQIIKLSPRFISLVSKSVLSTVLFPVEVVE